MNLKNFILFISVCVAADVYANSIAASTASCKNGWTLYDPWCFRIVEEKFNWKKASLHCNNLGGTLASIHSSEQNEILGRILKTYRINRAWIGLQNYTPNANSRWDDGSDVEYKNWKKWDTPITSTNYCAALDSASGEWIQTPCHRIGYSICQKHDFTGDSTSNQKNGSSVHRGSPLAEEHFHVCGHGWHKNGNYCYHLGVHARKWDSAVCHCLRQGGYLTSIHSKKEQDYLNHFFLKGLNEKVWIGLHDISIEGQYTWEDGSQFDYHNWNIGEPSGVKNSQEDCVELLPDQGGDSFGRWNDVPCNDSKAFICKKHVEIKDHKSKGESNSQTQNQSAYFSHTTFIFIISILIIALIAQMGVTIYYRRQWLKERPHKETQVLYKSDSRQRIIQ